MVGVYRIKNIINENCYYGSSKNIEKRWENHKNKLRKNKHINKILQRAWDKYGESNFLFEVVEECEKKDLYSCEQKYLDLNPKYNIGKESCGGDNISKNPRKKEMIKKITKSVRDRFSNMSEKEKKEKYSRPLDKNPNWKGGVTYVYCKCGKRIGCEHKNCNKCRPRSEEKNPFFGKKHSEETKTKLSENKLGKYNGEQNIPILIDNVEYRSAGEASKKLSMPMVTIRWRVMSKNKKFDNYKYKISN